MNSVKYELFDAISARLDRYLEAELESGLIDILWKQVMMRLYSNQAPNLATRAAVMDATG